MTSDMRTVFSARFTSSVLIAYMLVVNGRALAQDYPTKPLRCIVPYSAGGSSDFVARLLAQKLTDAWGQQVLVENRPGAAGNIGAETVVRAPPDGYTMLLVSSTFATNPSLYPKLAFDSVKDFAAVTMVLWQPFILSAHPSLPVASVTQLIVLAKARPGELNFSTGGNGTSGHIAAELFMTMAGIRMAHVPYRSMAPAITALLTGEVHINFNSPLSALEYMKAGKVKALAVTGRQRLGSMPNIPTVSESGVPGFEEGNWQGVLLPTATPRAIVVKLNQEIVRIANSREVSERVRNMGADLIANTPEEFAATIRSDIAKYAAVVKAARIRAE
ncbi:MAG TPA: tripartite tricarboxylate transporter substrate binding protein [Burkholderiales bacterium]|nr:tripartite tricarboxylate transporter substrate binding protein [Burkholderiales bacterium]